VSDTWSLAQLCPQRRAQATTLCASPQTPRVSIFPVHSLRWFGDNILSEVASATKSLLIAFLCFCSGTAFAQSPGSEPAAIIELGGAFSRSLQDGESSFGPTVALEVTPIKKWLEIEAGVTPLFARHSTEWNADLLLKKPWDLSEKAEFMVGVGPEWVHTNKPGATTNSISGVGAADVMYGPSAERRVGWYVEPAYEYNFGRGHEQSFGISGGMLIAIQ